MRFLMRLISAFCVATVIAQCLIMALVALRGNLHKETLTKAVALFNGIDIAGMQLQKAFDKARTAPIPSYDEVLSARAQQNLNLEMRERSVQQYSQQVEQMQAELKKQTVEFDRRKDAFYNLLDEMSKKGKEANLGEIQRTLEALAPEQAKALLVKKLEAKQMDDVVAIVKGMALDKRKKILGEFNSDSEITQVHDILNKMALGEPEASIIEAAKNASQPVSPSNSNGSGNQNGSSTGTGTGFGSGSGTGKAP